MVDYKKIRCPICMSPLVIGQELVCSNCKITYPIKKGIPIMLSSFEPLDNEQDLAIERAFYEEMFSNLKGFDDGHCIVYGHDRIYDFLEGLEQGSVLEVGCGGGHHSVNLSKRGFEVTAIDLSLNALFAAKKLAKHEGHDILFICGDIKQLPFEDDEFDICFCSLVLHHFMGLGNIIKELVRVTRSYFIAFEVNALDPLSFIRFNLINPIFGIKNISKNQRALFPKGLAKLLTENGFMDVIIKYEDIHDSIGKMPNSLTARMILIFQKIMKIFPEKYSKNKFMLSAKKKEIRLGQKTLTY